MYWSLLNKKMKELNLSSVEQKLIREDFMKQEALVYREK